MGEREKNRQEQKRKHFTTKKKGKDVYAKTTGPACTEENLHRD
jgi:hypothetical protein